MHRPLRPRPAQFLVIAGCLSGLAPAIGSFTVVPARAQEPLFLRIRPVGDSPTGLGGAGVFNEDIARAARARSEAVWQRAEARSRIAIASVCTGCLAVSRPTEPSLRPTPPPPALPEPNDVVPVAADTPAASIPPLAQADAP